MRCLIIGGAGFLGRRLAESLQHAGNDVVVCDDFSGSMRGPLPLAIRCIEANATSVNTMRSVFASFKPEVIIMSVAYHYARDVIYTFSEDTKLVTTSAIVLSGLLGPEIKHLCFVSSSEVYEGAQTNLPLKEASRLAKSATHHGTAKLAAERLLEFRCMELGIPYTVFRVCDLYGPRVLFTPRSDMVNFIIEAFLTGEPIGVVDARKKRDFIHVDDATSAIFQLVASSKTGVFNIGTGAGTTPRSVCRRLLELIPGVYPPREVKGRFPGHSLVADVSRLREALGGPWRPEHDIISDLPELVEFRKQGLTKARRDVVG